MFFRIIQHLLPRGKAWRLTIDKTLRRFFEGLSGFGADAKTFVDEVWLDLFPQTTRDLQVWEAQFGLADSTLDEQARRDRLAAAWRAQGGQSPSYIQTTLQDRGFDVFVHEWWEPGDEPAVGAPACPTPRNPLSVLRQSSTALVPGIQCDEPLALCGEAGALAGNTTAAQGFPLVNRITTTRAEITSLAGEAAMSCGEPEALCGNFSDFVTETFEYVIPTDQEKWHYFLYIGGATYPELATVPASRRDEFERLCLQICPAQQWLGMLVQYS